MKIIITLCLLSCSVAFGQRAQFGLYVPVDIPVKSTMPYMGTNVGIGLSAAAKPVPTLPVYLELKGSIGSYYSRTLSQTYVFMDGSSTTTDVRFSSSMNKVLFGPKVVIGSEYRGFRMFLTPQIGYAFMRSRIYIEDPTDPDGCKALERRKTQRFSGMVYGGELGAELSLDRLFSGVHPENRHRVFFALSYLRGVAPFEYVNVKYMKDEPHGMEMDGMNDPNDDRTDIDATFINVSSQNTHEHKVAELYRTPLEFVGFKIGYILSF